MFTLIRNRQKYFEVSLRSKALNGIRGFSMVLIFLEMVVLGRRYPESVTDMT